MSAIKCPTCPGCGADPVIVLAGSPHALCGSEDCPVLSWCPLVSAEENLAGASTVELPAELGAEGDAIGGAR